MRLRPLTAVGPLFLALAQPLAAAVIFVDPNGADANPGTPAQPLGSVARAAQRAQSGDVVVVRPGVYRESVMLTGAGDAGSSIVLRGLPGAVMESPDPSRSLSAFDVSAAAAHVIIEGFELRGGFAETVYLRPGAHDIELAGLHIHDNRTGVWVAGARDVIVRDCVIDHNYRTGIRIFAGAQDVQVVDTRVEANDDGLGCQGDSDGVSADESTANVSLDRVTAVGNAEDGFDLQTQSVTVRQCVVRDNGCSGVKLAAGAIVQNTLVERNATGINISGEAGHTAIVQSCTLLENALGVRAAGGGYGLRLVGSIVAGPGKALSYAAAVNVSEAFNVLYRPVSKDRLIVRVDGVDEARYSGIDIGSGRWQRESGQGWGTVYAEPRLAPGSAEPLGDSPALDSGDASLAPPVDLVGGVRPAGPGVDRGARERAPAPPALRTRRALARADEDGLGRLSLQIEAVLPAGARFDPRDEALSVAVRGKRGDVVRIESAAQASGGSRKMAAKSVRNLQIGPPEPPLRLRVVTDGSRVRLWFDAYPIRLWTVDGGQAVLSVELGRMRVAADVILRYRQ